MPSENQEEELVSVKTHRLAFTRILLNRLMLSWLIYLPHAGSAYSILLTTILKKRQPLNIHYLVPNRLYGLSPKVVREIVFNFCDAKHTEHRLNEKSAQRDANTARWL